MRRVSGWDSHSAEFEGGADKISRPCTNSTEPTARSTSAYLIKCLTLVIGRFCRYKTPIPILDQGDYDQVKDMIAIRLD
jgi:hypothetical protein